MKLKFQQPLSSANGLTDLEVNTVEAFKFLFLNENPKMGIIIQSPVFSTISGVPEFTIVEREDDVIYAHPLDTTLLTANSELVGTWLGKGDQIRVFENAEAMQQELKYKDSTITFIVMNTKIVKGDDQNTFFLTNTFCVKFKTGRFAGESFFLMITFKIDSFSKMMPDYSVCLSKLKTTQLFDTSGLLILE